MSSVTLYIANPRQDVILDESAQTHLKETGLFPVKQEGGSSHVD